jgi:DnaJ-class molecular chaperone
MSDNNLNDLLQKLKHSISGDACLGDNKELRLCEEVSDKIEQLQKENKAALKLLTVHTCPDCNGDGAYYDNYGNPVQCQYCYEVGQLISNKEE